MEDYMNDREPKYGYDFEGHTAWLNEQNRKPTLDPSVPHTYTPEEHFTKYANAPAPDPIKSGVLDMWLAEHSRQIEELNRKWAEFDAKQAASKRALDSWNNRTAMDHLSEIFRVRGAYLAKNPTSIEDIELSERMFDALFSVRMNGDFSLMEGVFNDFREIAKKDEVIADVLPSWEKEFNKAKQNMQKKETYKEKNWFARLIAKLKGEKTKSIEEGKTR